jgi:hypothetical protein
VELSPQCWDCPIASWAALLSASISLGCFLAVLFLLRRRNSRIRALGGLLAFPAALFYLVTTVSTLRYGVTANGGWNEPRNDMLGLAIVGGLYVASIVAFWWHRRIIHLREQVAG